MLFAGGAVGAEIESFREEAVCPPAGNSMI